jgi:predicted porin
MYSLRLPFSQKNEIEKVRGRIALRSLVQMSRLSILLCAVGGIGALAQQAPADKSVTSVITCTSKSGERQVCKADTSAGVALLHSTGDSVCLLGKNWGYDDTGVWVSNGCGGEFVVGGSKEASGLSNFVGMFEPYGQIRVHLAAYQSDAQVQDNATRLGINFATRGKIKVIAGTEWGVNLVQSESDFNLSSAGPGSFGTVTTTTNPVFLARLGFAGVDFGPFGKVALGKMYSVQYDIAGYTTDRFNVFGGQGSFAYVAGTDGGETGTGRADRIVNYRNTILKIIDIGIQGQFRDVGNDHTTDGEGASLQFTILPGVKAGATYTRTNWSPAQQQQVQDLGANSDFIAAGTRIDWRILQMGAVYAHQHNGDVAFVPTPGAPEQTTAIVYDAHGVEVYARAGLGKLGLIGGFIYQDPKVRNPLLDPNFRTRYFILGAEWFFAKNGKIYSESKINSGGVMATGQSDYSVFTIGFRYDFSWRASHQP